MSSWQLFSNWKPSPAASVGDVAVKKAVLLTSSRERGVYKYTASRAINHKPSHTYTSKHNCSDCKLCKSHGFLEKHLLHHYKRLIKNGCNNESLACLSGREYKVQEAIFTPFLPNSEGNVLPKKMCNSTLDPFNLYFTPNKRLSADPRVEWEAVISNQGSDL